jgi:hypothetical protein
MLSHHELATLMLLRDTGRHLEELDPDVLALRRYELVEVRMHDRHGCTAAGCNRDVSRAMLNACRPPTVPASS